MSKTNSTLFIIVCILGLVFSGVSLVDSKQKASANETSSQITRTK